MALEDISKMIEAGITEDNAIMKHIKGTVSVCCEEDPEDGSILTTFYDENADVIFQVDTGDNDDEDGLLELFIDSLFDNFQKKLRAAKIMKKGEN